MTVLGQNRLGMELHSLDRQAAVTQPHDDAGIRTCRHLQLGGNLIHCQGHGLHSKTHAEDRMAGTAQDADAYPSVLWMPRPG